MILTARALTLGRPFEPGRRFTALASRELPILEGFEKSRLGRKTVDLVEHRVKALPCIFSRSIEGTIASVETAGDFWRVSAISSSGHRTTH